MLTGKLPRRAAVWSLAHSLARLEEYAFDYALYPYMLYSGGEALLRLVGRNAVTPEAGYWMGFAVLCLASLLLNLLYLRLYDWSRRDWFGFEYLKSVRVPERLAGARFVRPALRIAAFCYLSVWHSPLFATLWVRADDHAFRMGRKDWALFGAAIFIANVGWTIVVTAVVAVARALTGNL